MGTWEHIRHLYFSLVVAIVVTKASGFVPKGLYWQREGLTLALNSRATEPRAVRPYLFCLKKITTNPNWHQTKQRRITQRGNSYGTDNCCQLTSRPDPSSDLIAALASSFSSYFLISGLNPKSKAAISRISSLHLSRHLVYWVDHRQRQSCPACTLSWPDTSNLLPGGQAVRLRQCPQAAGKQGYQLWHSMPANTLGLEVDTSVQLPGQQSVILPTAWLFRPCLPTETREDIVLFPFPFPLTPKCACLTAHHTRSDSWNSQMNLES